MVLGVSGLSKMIGIVSAAAAKREKINDKIERVCDLDNYVVYTDVAKFYDWINQVILFTCEDFQADFPESTTKSFLDKVSSFFGFS